MDFRGKNPIETFQYLVNTDGNFLYDGSGSMIPQLNLTTSYALYQVLWEESSSFASRSFASETASYASQSISASWTFGTSSWANTSSLSINTLSSSVVSVLPTVSDINYIVYVTASLPPGPSFADLRRDIHLMYDSTTDSLISPQISASGMTASLLVGTSSWANTSSFISPSAGTVSNAGPITGSATSASNGAWGFATDVEFNTFITSTSSSLILLNDLLSKLRSKGIIN